MRSTVASSNWRPVSCRPSGKRSALNPQATLIAGSPARLALTVKMSARYICSGSSVRSPSLNAAVGLVGTYVYYGLAMVLLTAGVQKIPTSLYDAARVDGAGAFREFLAVTLPALRGEIAVALTLTTIYALRNFDLVYITTHGGPGHSTTVPAFQVFSRAFESGQVGSAAAVGVVLTFIIFVITVGINRLGEGRS